MKRTDYKFSLVGAVVSLRADTALVKEFARFKKIKYKRNERKTLQTILTSAGPAVGSDIRVSPTFYSETN
jgi:hypothetical protein